MRYPIFFAVLLKVIQDSGLQYFYSIPSIVPQSWKTVDQNWPKAVRWNKYDRICFIAASLHKQASLFDSSIPCNSTKWYSSRVPPIVPQNRFGVAVLLLWYHNSTVLQTKFGVTVLLLRAVLLFET